MHEPCVSHAPVAHMLTMSKQAAVSRQLARTSWLNAQVATTRGHGMGVPDKVCHISNVHAHTEVASRKGLNRQGVIQITCCRGVYAEQPAATQTPNCANITKHCATGVVEVSGTACSPQKSKQSR